MLKTIVVASLNPVKIEATRKAFIEMFPGESFEFTGKGVASEVADQPMGVEETKQGAENRIKNLKKITSDADFLAGIEGGIRKEGNEWYAFAWIIIESNDGTTGKAMTGHFLLPPPVVRLLEKGYELGHADDIIFDDENSKQRSGSVGILTANVINRTEYYVHAAILALIPFKKPELFTQ